MKPRKKYLEGMAISIYKLYRRAHDFENWRRDIKKSLQIVKIFMVYRRVFH